MFLALESFMQEVRPNKKYPVVPLSRLIYFLLTLMFCVVGGLLSCLTTDRLLALASIVTVPIVTANAFKILCVAAMPTNHTHG